MAVQRRHQPRGWCPPWDIRCDSAVSPNLRPVIFHSTTTNLRQSVHRASPLIRHYSFPAAVFFFFHSLFLDTHPFLLRRFALPSYSVATVTPPSFRLITDDVTLRPTNSARRFFIKMASKAAHKRVRGTLNAIPSYGFCADILTQLTREFKTISETPPPYITAHPSDSNILEYARPHITPIDKMLIFDLGGTTSSPVPRKRLTMAASTGEP